MPVRVLSLDVCSMLNTEPGVPLLLLLSSASFPPFTPLPPLPFTPSVFECAEAERPSGDCWKEGVLCAGVDTQESKYGESVRLSRPGGGMIASSLSSSPSSSAPPSRSGIEPPAFSEF